MDTKWGSGDQGIDAETLGVQPSLRSGSQLALREREADNAPGKTRPVEVADALSEVGSLEIRPHLKTTLFEIWGRGTHQPLPCLLDSDFVLAFHAIPYQAVAAGGQLVNEKVSAVMILLAKVFHWSRYGPRKLEEGRIPRTGRRRWRRYVRSAVASCFVPHADAPTIHTE